MLGKSIIVGKGEISNLLQVFMLPFHSASKMNIQGRIPIPIAGREEMGMMGREIIAKVE